MFQNNGVIHVSIFITTFGTKAAWMQNIFKSYTEPGGTLEMYLSSFNTIQKKKDKMTLSHET